MSRRNLGDVVVRSLILVLAFVALTSALPASAQTTTAASWQFELTPYGWLAGMSGEIGVGEKETHASASFTDIARNLDSAFMLHFEARENRWGFFVDPFYINLGASIRTPYGWKLAISNEQLIVQAQGTYSVYEKNGKAFDLLFGGRYNDLRTDLTPSGVPIPAKHVTQSWVDPIVGFRARFDLGHRWAFGIRGDVGGGLGDSKLAWDAVARFDVRASKSVFFNFGYSVVGVDYESGSGASRFLYNVRMDGPFVGVAFRF